MPLRTYGRTRIQMPDLGSDVTLASVSSLAQGDTTREFRYDDQVLRDLDLCDSQLFTGKINRLDARRATFECVAISSVEFSSSVIGTLAWNGARTSRAVFRNCKLMAADIGHVTFSNVLFENCRLDFTTFRQVRVEQALVFDRCVLSEASFTACDLGNAVFRDCVLDLTEFGQGRYHHCDMRDNDLSAIRGVPALKGVIINRTQTEQLTTALLADLSPTYGEDLDDHEESAQ